MFQSNQMVWGCRQKHHGPAMIVVDETELIAQSQQGDVHAFNRLVERYQGQVYALCYRLLGDVGAAEDACQEVFLSAFRGIRRYRGESFAGWLLRIARNECYDQLRARRRHISLDTAQEDMNVAPRLFVDPSEAPEERALRSELAQTLERLLQALPPDQRLVVVLRDVQGYGFPELLAATGWPPGTIKSRLSRGRARLRTALQATAVRQDVPEHQASVVEAEEAVVW